MNNLQLHITCLCALLIGGCVSNNVRTLPPDDSSVTVTPSTELHEQPPKQTSLSSELVYDTLTAEIAAQRGDYETAFTHAYRAAQQSRSSSTAERATQFALQAKLTQEALQATDLWLELEPDSLGANQIAVLLTAKLKQTDRTLHHLREVIRIANAKGQNGYLNAAAIAEKAGSAEQSLELIQRVIPADTENSDALYAIALSALQAKQYALAEQAITRALQHKPDWSLGMLLLSRILIAQDRMNEGLQVLDRALTKAPKDTELRLTYARLLLDNDRLEDSLRQFEVLNQQNPNNQDILFALGIISSELKHYDSAKAYFNRLTKGSKKGSEANFHLGLIAQKQNDPETAFAHFSKVSGDNQVDARIQMARILAERGELDKAQHLLERLLIAYPQYGVKFHLIEADLLRNAYKFDTANEIYTRGLELYKENTELLYARALNAVDMGKLQILEQDLHHILSLHPDHVDALNALGYTLADQTKRLDEAKQYIQKALSLKPDSPAILDSMGWVEFRMGNLDTALNFLRQAADFSQDAEIASHLGEVLWRMGYQKEALDVWQKAIQQDPDNGFIKPVMRRLGAD